MGKGKGKKGGGTKEGGHDSTVEKTKDNSIKTLDSAREVQISTTYAAVVAGMASLRRGLKELQESKKALKAILKESDEGMAHSDGGTSRRELEDKENLADPVDDTASTDEEEEVPERFWNTKANARAKVERQHLGRYREGRYKPYGNVRPSLPRKSKSKKALMDAELKEPLEELDDVAEATLDYEMLRYDPQANGCDCGKMYSNYTLLVIHKLSCGKEINKPNADYEADDLRKDPDFNL